MLKNIIIILLLIISVGAKAQTSTYKTPEQYPDEFAKLSHEYLQWDNNNSSVTNYNYSKIDTHVLSLIKTTNTQNLDYLVSMLTKPCVNDLEKVRSFYIWLINSMKYSISIRDSFPTSVRSSDSREDDALFCFMKRRGACVEISSIFYLMCKKANIRAFVIGGYYKELNYSKNGYVEAGHAWNAFKYNDTYYFLDATFGLQTKQKNEIFKTVNFVINSELYKYLYTPYDIYGNLNYKVNNNIYNQERDWVLYLLQYESPNRVKDSDWVEFNKVRIMIEKTYFINRSEWIKYPIFGYENYNLTTIKKWASVYKEKVVEVGVCPVDTFILLKEKEYKKLKNDERILYNSSAEQYYPYWINYYKIKGDIQAMKKMENEFTYYKIFKK